MDERRKHPRIGLAEMPVALRVGRTIRACQIEDVSLSGARVKVEFPIEIGTAVALRHGAYGDLPASVVRVFDGAVGLQFVLTEDTIRYVTDMLIDRLKSGLDP